MLLIGRKISKDQNIYLFSLHGLRQSFYWTVLDFVSFTLFLMPPIFYFSIFLEESIFFNILWEKGGVPWKCCKTKLLELKILYIFLKWFWQLFCLVFYLGAIIFQLWEKGSVPPKCFSKDQCRFKWVEGPILPTYLICL